MSIIRAVGSAMVAGAVLMGCATSSEPAAQQPSEAAITAATSLAPAAPTSDSLAEEALLPPGSMPEWNGAVVWETATNPPEVLQSCPVPTMTDLGAVAQVSRSYVWPVGGMAGVNTVGQFESADAAQAAAVELEGVVAQCPDVTQISNAATGSTWTTGTVIDGESDDARFEFLALADVDDLVTVVAFTLTAQDANWESDPIIDSLEASVGLLADRG